MTNWRKRVAEQTAEISERVGDVNLDLERRRWRREDEAESGGFIGGFALGVVVGALLALIFTPWKGDETRERVVERAGQLKERATDLVAHVRGEEEAGDATGS